MSALPKYEFLACAPRQVGHTTAAAGHGDGTHILITATHRQALDASRAHGVDALNLHDANNRLRGRDQPIVMDLHAVQVMRDDYEEYIAKLRARYETAIGNISRAVADAQILTRQQL